MGTKRVKRFTASSCEGINHELACRGYDADDVISIIWRPPHTEQEATSHGGSVRDYPGCYEVFYRERGV